VLNWNCGLNIMTRNGMPYAYSPDSKRLLLAQAKSTGNTD
jgi:hypothetical protein